MRTFTFRHALQIFVFAAAAGSFAAWAGDAALISAIDGNKACTATLDNATWTPLLGETIPEKTGLDVGADTTVNLVHFGTNSEVTLPAGARVTVLMSGIEGLASGTNQAKLEEMPKGLDLEARHQQQVGAVNMQHMAQLPQLEKSAAPAKSRATPSAGAIPAASVPVPPTSAPAVPEKSAESSTISGFSDQVPAVMPATRGGGGAGHEALNELEAPAEGGKLAYEAAKQEYDEAKAMLQDSQAAKEKASPAVVLAVALPLERLNGTIGEFESFGVKAETGAETSSPERTVIYNSQENATSSWILTEVTLPAGMTESDLTVQGREKAAKLLSIAAIEGTALSVSTALRLEFRGYPAQAAALWIKLAKADIVSPDIAARHLKRLADAIASKLR